MTILLLNGPNINLLGTRETKYYGTIDYLNLISNLHTYAKQYNFNLIDYQSNSESKLINTIHYSITQNIKYIIFNPGAFSHTSIALRDAMLSINIPFVEVHITNIYQRENFRQKSYFSDIANGIFIGLGIYGYFLAINYIHNILNNN